MLAVASAQASGWRTSEGEELKARLLVSLDNLEAVALDAGLSEQLLNSIEENRALVLQTPARDYAGLPQAFTMQFADLQYSTLQLKQAFRQPRPPELFAKSSGFPSAPYPNVGWSFAIDAVTDVPDGEDDGGSDGALCSNPGFSPNAQFLTLNAALLAEGVKDMAEQFCSQSGLGFNAAVACVVTDLAYIITKAVHENRELCNSFVTAAEVNGSYNRVGHLHDDIEEIDSDIANVDADLASARSAILAAIAQHDSDLKSALSTHDTEIKSMLGNIQAGVDANSDKLDVLITRQLEVIRLLHTPEGRRSTDVPACDGTPCRWNP